MTTFTEWLEADPSRVKFVSIFCKVTKPNVRRWKYRISLNRAEQLSAFTGLSVDEIMQVSPKPTTPSAAKVVNRHPFIDGQSPKFKKLWAVRANDVPTNLDNELMGTPPNGRSVWDQTKAIRGPDGRLLSDSRPLDITDTIARIKNITRPEQAHLPS